MGKTCPKCQTPDALFGLNKARKDGLAVYCRTCTKAYLAEKQYDKARWQERRADESARNRAYREANAERLRAQWREKANRRRAELPSVIRSHNIARKHGECQATPPWADHAAMSAVYARARALEAEDGIPRHVDHEVPLKNPLVCGLHAHTNLRILTAAENMAKKNRWTVA